MNTSNSDIEVKPYSPADSTVSATDKDSQQQVVVAGKIILNAALMTPMEMNSVHFSRSHTLLTPEYLDENT